MKKMSDYRKQAQLGAAQLMLSVKKQQAQAQYGYAASKRPNCTVLIVSLEDDVIEFENDLSYDKINTTRYENNKLWYTYDPEEEDITEDLKRDLVKILYHKINSEIKHEQKILDKKISKMKGFSKYLRFEKIKRLIPGND